MSLSYIIEEAFDSALETVILNRVLLFVLSFPSGPPPKPFIGNIGELMGADPKANVRNLFKTYSPLMKVRF